VAKNNEAELRGIKLKEIKILTQLKNTKKPANFFTGFHQNQSFCFAKNLHFSKTKTLIIFWH